MEENYYPEPPERELKVTVEIPVYWSNSEIEAQVAAAIVALIKSDLLAKVRERVFDTLDDTVNSIIQEVMEKPVQKTNTWGEPVGPLDTVRGLLLREMEEWLTERVDNYGHSSSASYSRKQTRAQYLFKEAVKGHLPDRVKKVISEQIGDIDDLIKTEVVRQLKAKLK